MTALKTLPSTFRKLVVNKLSPVFRDSVAPVSVPLTNPDFNQVLIRNRYVGINASDVNVAAGRYHKEKPKLPFDLGFEGVGEIVGIGESVSDFKVGQSVMYMGNNSFAEYVYMPEGDVIPIPLSSPEFVPLLVSGTTSSLSLDKAGRIAPGEKVLITAAAGGAGHIAVQWAKCAGCHVIGLCSSDKKADFLKRIGCDRAINYKQESLETTLKSEYPNGVDVIWETIGSTVFDILLRNLAIKGRLIVIGATSSYKEAKLSSKSETQDLPLRLLRYSSTVSGFFLTHYKSDIPHYLSLLIRLMHEEKLQIAVDTGYTTEQGPFKGLEDIVRAVEHLHSAQSIGKVVVAL